MDTVSRYSKQMRMLSMTPTVITGIFSQKCQTEYSQHMYQPIKTNSHSAI